MHKPYWFPWVPVASVSDFIFLLFLFFVSREMFWYKYWVCKRLYVFTTLSSALFYIVQRPRWVVSSFYLVISYWYPVIHFFYRYYTWLAISVPQNNWLLLHSQTVYCTSYPVILSLYYNGFFHIRVTISFGFRAISNQRTNDLRFITSSQYRPTVSTFSWPVHNRLISLSANFSYLLPEFWYTTFLYSSLI